MGTKKVNNNKNTVTTVTTNNAPVTVEPLNTVEQQVTQPTVEPTVEPLYTKFTGNGITITVAVPCTVQQLQGTHSVYTNVQGVPTTTKGNKLPPNVLHASTIQNPVKYIFSTIQEVINSGITTRKGIIEHYMNMGVGYYTIRTQYQIWYNLNKKGTTPTT